MNEERFYSPSDFVSELNLTFGTYVADFGSGAGNFAVEMARHVGREGRIFAFDIRTPALQSLQSKARSAGYRNIKPVRSDLEEERGTGLPDEYVDLVLIHNIIFQVKDKKSLLQEAARVTKPGGRVAAVEWEKSSPIGPRMKDRMSKSELTDLFEKHGLAHEADLKAGAYHYGVSFHK